MDQIRSPFFSLSRYITLLVLSGAMAVCSFASGSCPKSVSGEWQSVDDLNNAPKVSIAARKIYTMVQGEIGRPVFLTETEYRKRVEEESIAEESILFVDRLPTDIDLPTVRGVVMGTPLVAEGTHIQVFAEKMEIPLVLVPKFQEIPVFKEALESQKPISINSESQLVVRTYSSIPMLPFRSSLLPEVGPRDILDIAQPGDGKVLRRVFGDKYVPMQELAQHLSSRYLPSNMLSLSSGYSLWFYKSYRTESGILLSEYLEKMQSDLAQTRDPELVKLILEDIREEILGAESMDQGRFFSKLAFDLSKKIKSSKKNRKFSLRSNNDVEDLIGAGLYKSVVLEDLSLQELERGFKEVLASQFTFRAYSVRRKLGLIESRLAMPLFLHEYVAGEKYSGTMRIQQREGYLIANIQVIEGQQSKATNPDSTAKVMDVSLVQEANGKWRQTARRSTMSVLLKRALKKSLSLLQESLEGSFYQRVYPPNHVDIEFVLLRSKMRWGFTPVFLQYKNTLPREVVQDALNGVVGREDIERRIEVKDYESPFWLKGALKILKLQTTPNAKDTTKGHVQKFILVESHDGSISNLFWNDGRYHDSIAAMIRKMKLPFKILGGGYWYINLEKSRIVIGDSGSRKLKMDIDMDSVKNQLRQGIHSVFSEDSYWMQNFKTYESNMASDFTYQPIPLVDFTEAP